MSEPSVSMLRQVAEEAARRSGALLAEKFDQPRLVERKGRIDLVTDADKASETALLAFLREQVPGHAILAEEGGAHAGSEYRWIVDPLDGTTNYAHNVPHFAVSIAVEGPGGLLAGAVYDPIKREMFSAEKGGGATLNGRPLRVTQVSSFDDALLATGFPYDVREKPNPALALFNHFILLAQGVRRLGSAALDLAYVASGRFDGFFETALKPWDMAAGALLIREAGGKISQADGTAFNVNAPTVAAAGPALYDALIRGCKTVLDSHR